MYKTKTIKVRHLWYSGIAIFILGFILGGVIITANFMTIMHYFRPEPRKMSEILAKQINEKMAKDFNIPKENQDRIREIIITSQSDFSTIFKSTFKKIEKLKESLIQHIAEEIPSEKDREYFLENKEKYFPAPPPAKFFDKGGPPPPPPPLN